MHLFIELITLAFLLLTVVHGLRTRGRTAIWLFVALLYAGFVRESYVALQEILYGFAPLGLMLGKAPLIASIIWAYSIYLAICWAEAFRAEDLTMEAPTQRAPSGPFLASVGLFMVTLVGFYEPFLELIGMARWEEGTRATLGVPWIALVGYPSFAIPCLLVWSWVMRALRTRAQRLGTLAMGLGLLGLGHAAGLKALKDALGW